MATNPTIVAAVAGGYLLGRTKKLGFALKMVNLVSGQKVDLTPLGIVRQIGTLAKDNPEIAKLQQELIKSARAAVIAQATQGLDQLTTTLRSGVPTEVKDSVEDQTSAAADSASDASNKVGDMMNDSKPEQQGDEDMPKDSDEEKGEEISADNTSEEKPSEDTNESTDEGTSESPNTEKEKENA